MILYSCLTGSQSTHCSNLEPGHLSSPSPFTSSGSPNCPYLSLIRLLSGVLVFSLDYLFSRFLWPRSCLCSNLPLQLCQKDLSKEYIWPLSLPSGKSLKSSLLLQQGPEFRHLADPFDFCATSASSAHGATCSLATFLTTQHHLHNFIHLDTSSPSWNSSSLGMPGSSYSSLGIHQKSNPLCKVPATW